ncbi:hypothetical protein GCM10010218_38000 [Streptomyces mashuensis]|uniref:Uncharacterized protein n=1 Tax=Streptomyces mashuensis TaxID=33904 RepID=A0A919EED5_9ACTN|nr:hypothetical protein [Streptomyces mashuensis]GHF52942.1 hypothetical protein GCM10010218_38000 [Streptomyces mashuensis]
MAWVEIRVDIDPRSPRVTAQLTGIKDWVKGEKGEKDKNGRVSIAIRNVELKSIALTVTKPEWAKKPMAKFNHQWAGVVSGKLKELDVGIPLTRPFSCEFPVPGKDGEPVDHVTVLAHKLALDTYEGKLLVHGEVTVS